MTITAPPPRTRPRVQPRTPAAPRTQPGRTQPGRVQPGRVQPGRVQPGRTRTAAPDAPPARGRTGPAGSPDAPQGRARSAASRRAYARKAQRTAVAGGQRCSLVARRTPFVLLVMATLATGLIVSLWLSTAASADSYRLEQARLQARSLSERSAQLQQEVANLQTAPELAARARALGMVPTDEPARLVVQPDGTVAVVGKPAPATAPPPPVPPAPPVDPAAGTPPAAGTTPADPAAGAPAAGTPPADPAAGTPPADPAAGAPPPAGGGTGGG